MQRLVAILLRDGYPITHTVGVGRIAVAHDRVGGPAETLLILTLAVDDDTQSEDVEDSLEGHSLLTHLIPDGVDRLGAALDVVSYILSIETLDDRL